ncbi:ATP-binding protein [Spirillospora sp. CA-294931]|uniref:ATP-binding protein n=1 Tax=Spirillospora sp. CA-294931 TaxID=3240042 RepID=UPI003D9384B8
MGTEIAQMGSSSDVLPGFLSLPAEAESIKYARDHVKNECERMGFTADAVYRAALVVSELMTNAFKHGSESRDDTIGVRFFRGDAGPVLEVSDESDDLPVVGGFDFVGESGRGLALMELIVQSWGVNPSARSGGRGKVVWALLIEGDLPRV